METERFKNSYSYFIIWVLSPCNQAVVQPIGDGCYDVTDSDRYRLTVDSSCQAVRVDRRDGDGHCQLVNCTAQGVVVVVMTPMFTIGR